MESMKAEEAARYLQLTLPALEQEHKFTTRVIEAVPAEKGSYCPEPCSRTAFDLAWHIAATDCMFLDAASSAQFDFSKSKRPESIKNPADVAKWYAEAWQDSFKRLAQTPGEQLAKVVDFRGLMKIPAVLCARLGIHHTIHHRGQLTVYLRPMGAKVPSIYGESYDDAQARKAAQASTA